MFIPVGDSFINVLNVSFIRPDVVTTKGTETDTSGNSTPVDMTSNVVDIFMTGGGEGVQIQNKTSDEVAKILNAGVEKYIDMLGAAIARHQN